MHSCVPKNQLINYLQFIMKKFLLALVVLSGTAYGALAQTSEAGKFSIGVELGLPFGDNAEGYSFAIGGSLKYDHPVAENLFITGSAGYTNIMLESEYKDALDKSGFGFFPVKAGAKYFFSPQFFGEAQLGAVFATEDAFGTGFVYSPGVGYAFSENLEAGVRYEAWSNDGTLSQVGLRVAYKF